MFDGDKYLQVLSHILGDDSKTNTGEIVYGEPGILGYVDREHSLASMFHLGVLEPFCQRLQPHALHHLVHQYLDEDTRTRRSIIFVHPDAFEHHPRNGIGGEEMAKESGNITQTVRFVAMNRGVVIPKRSLQAIGPNAVELAKPFTDVSIERRIRPFLRTTLDNHVDQFNLQRLIK